MKHSLHHSTAFLLSAKLLSIFIAFTLSLHPVGTSHAQVRTVTGRVVDAESGQGLPQLSVKVKGQNRDTITDLEGHYSLEVSGPEVVLEFIYVGMATQEEVVGERTVIDVAMRPALEDIDQVVVVGYGSGKKIASTVGRVSSVGAQKLEAKPVANAMEALAGQVPGLSVLTSSGEPSSGAVVQLHGSGSLGAVSEPLYVLDGLPVAASTILAMNPDDFARVDVLSDASATSIYGSRAANGVIYITTKRGQLETKGSVQARYTFGLSNLANTRYFEQIQNTREVFDMFEYLGTHTPAQVADLRARYGDRTFRWYKYYYRQNAPTHSANVQFTGGGGRTSHFVSGGYFWQQGLRPLSSYTRYSLRANLNSKVLSWLQLGFNCGLSYDVSRRNTDSKVHKQGGLVMGNPSWLTPYDANGKEYDGEIPGTGLISLRH